jgi:hypothetical protein
MLPRRFMLRRVVLEIAYQNRGSQRMHHARWIVQLAAMPAFMALAAISFFAPSPICTIPGPVGFLTSMWFMYLVMAAAHSGAWFPLVAKLLSKNPSQALQPLDCCAPLLPEAQSRQDQRSPAARLVA